MRRGKQAGHRHAAGNEEDDDDGDDEDAGTLSKFRLNPPRINIRNGAPGCHKLACCPLPEPRVLAPTPPDRSFLICARVGVDDAVAVLFGVHLVDSRSATHDHDPTFPGSWIAWPESSGNINGTSAIMAPTRVSEKSATHEQR